MDVDTAVFEAVHNALAFSQFVNLMHLLLRDSKFGYLGFDSLNQAASGNVIKTPGINFIRKLAETGNPFDKLDVVRETFRILLPNGFSLSGHRTPEGPTNDGKAFTVS